MLLCYAFASLLLLLRRTICMMWKCTMHWNVPLVTVGMFKLTTIGGGTILKVA